MVPSGPSKLLVLTKTILEQSETPGGVPGATTRAAQCIQHDTVCIARGDPPVKRPVQADVPSSSSGVMVHPVNPAIAETTGLSKLKKQKGK